MRINQVFVVLAMSLVVSAGCETKEEMQEAAAKVELLPVSQQQKTLAGVKTEAMQYKVVTRVVSCTGEIEVPPQGMASVTAPLGGYIVKTEMIPGAQVRKGTLLATLSNPEYIILQQKFLETAGELTFAEQDYQRQKLLKEQDATAVKKFQESESTYKVLKARLAGLREQLKLIGINLKGLEAGNIQSVVNLRAPIDGFVTAVNNHPGEFVEPREVIFEIIDMSDLHLHLNVFEQDVASLSEGQVVRFRPAGGEAYIHFGSVSLVSPKKNTQERTFDVHGHIGKGSDQLKPGMYVEAQVLINDDSVYALPEKALVFNGNETLVLLEENGTYVEQPVETGAKLDGWVEIKNHQDLTNKLVVTQGATRLFTSLRR